MAEVRDSLEGDGEERRAFFRILTHLPVKCRKVAGREAETLAREIPERRAPETGRIDEALAVWLDRIERKLDRVLVHLGIGDPVAFSDADVQEVMLSGSGMAFVTDAEVVPGDPVLVEFEIPGVPAQLVRCLARVIRNLPAKKRPGKREAGDDRETTAVSFEVIHDSDREAIVRHAVEVQRKLIRRQRGGAAG